MSQPESDALSNLIQRVLDEQLERSPALRELARHLATLTLQRLEELDRPHTPAPEQPEPQATPAAPVPTPAPRTIVGPSSVVPLSIGDARIEVPVTGAPPAVMAAREAAQAGPQSDDDTGDYLGRTARARAIDLACISTRCQIKAASCRHQILRQNQVRDTPEELKSRLVMDEFIARAKTIPDCFLWMFFRKGEPTDDVQLDLIARCYEAMADAARLCHAIEPIDHCPDEDGVREALQLLSTTGSALRVSLEGTWLTQPDIDQDETHQWLKLVTSEHRFHVREHMQLGDPADPQTDMPAAHERARAMLLALQERKDIHEKAQRMLKKALYHARKIRDTTDSTYAEELPTQDCTQVNEVMVQLVELDPPGLAEMARQVAQLAPPELFPEEVPPHHRLVSAAAQNTAETKPRSKGDRESEGPGRIWSGDVLRVRELLKDGQIVVIGGEPRRDAIERMVDAFDLENVVWPELTEHGQSEPMRAPIANPSTRLVVVLIKLTGHEHAERARDFARQASVPFVHMPAGYNPEQIAAEVLRQASDQLRST